jgi:hypothetical protein
VDHSWLTCQTRVLAPASWRCSDDDDDRQLGQPAILYAYPPAPLRSVSFEEAVGWIRARVTRNGCTLTRQDRVLSEYTTRHTHTHTGTGGSNSRKPHPHTTVLSHPTATTMHSLAVAPLLRLLRAPRRCAAHVDRNHRHNHVRRRTTGRQRPRYSLLCPVPAGSATAAAP